jgi:DNA-binding PadR family transcriptional regulator
MTKLVVLGLLQRKPLYGYEIKQIIQDEMGDWTNIAFGSIYFALAQLAKEGFVQQNDPKKTNSRPAKIVYEITDKGKKEFSRKLEKIWKTHEHQYFSLDIAFFFYRYLPKAKIKKYLKEQLVKMEMALKYVAKHKKEELGKKEVPKEAEIIFDHTLHHMKAEHAWLKETIEKVDQLGR